MTATLFEDQRLAFDDCLEMTIASLIEWGARHDTWCVAWSGGKDSTALLIAVVMLIERGMVPPPKRLIVCYADTRMELPPLWLAAAAIREQLAERGIEVRIVMAPLDLRFYVYMLGRGVPPPNNNTFRWCTRQIKVKPMEDELKSIVAASGSVLMLTGVRQGESAVRDGRIAMSCGVNGAECGQGWYQQMTGDGFATLAPILHWRVCQVWDFLKVFAPSRGVRGWGGWETRLLADAYGGEEAEEVNARTGCIGCPLANHDTALDVVLRMPAWAGLAPLKGLRPLFRELRQPHNRLRQPPGEKRKDGTLSNGQNRMGPLTLAARRMALAAVLDIQARCRPVVDLINQEERQRIEELIDAGTFPNRWTGDEPRADELYVASFADGSFQPTLFGN